MELLDWTPAYSIGACLDWDLEILEAGLVALSQLLLVSRFVRARVVLAALL